MIIKILTLADFVVKLLMSRSYYHGVWFIEKETNSLTTRSDCINFVYIDTTGVKQLHEWLLYNIYIHI